MAIDLTAFTEAATVQPKPSQIVIYGRNGIGKSSIGASTQFGPGASNAVYMNVNNRIGHLAVAGNKNVIHTYEDYKDFVTYIIEGQHNFSTLFVDTADDLERVFMNEVVRENNVKSIEAMAYQAGYAEAVTKWVKFLKTMTMIRDKRNMTIVILAQVDVKKQNNPDAENYDIVCPKLHGSTLKGDATMPLLMAWADLVMYMKDEVYTKTETGGFADKKNPKHKAVANGGIYLNTKSHPAYRAKDSYGLPDKIDCSADAWGQIMNGINSYWNAQAPSAPPKEKPEIISIPTAHLVQSSPLVVGAQQIPISASNGQIFNLTE